MNEKRKGWRKTGARLYIAVWQLLRGGAAILLLVCYAIPLIVAYYGSFSTEDIKNTSEVRQETDPRMVCGMISNTIIEVPREYIVFWPEYEGKSSWEKGFTSNIKGCDAKLASLYMSVSWPDFLPLPINRHLVDNSRFSGLEITISPAIHRTDNMQFFLDKRLNPENFLSDEHQNKYYDNSLRLFYIDSSGTIVPDVMNRYYWAEKDGSITVVFECYRTRKSTKIYRCSGYFTMSGFDYSVELGFSRDELRNWQEIVAKTKKFIFTKVRK